MKRSGFKRKLKAPVKRKKATRSVGKLKKDLWLQFSLFIRRRDNWTCFICDRKCEGSGYHAAHFVPKSVGGLALYFHEENVHGCCYNCNINLGGNYYLYGKKLGEGKCQELYALKGRITKWTEQDYLNLIERYKLENSLS